MNAVKEKESEKASVVGKVFAEAREARRLTIAKVSEITHIPERLLYRLEAEEYDKLPPDAFLRGTIAKYSDALGLDAQEMLAKYYASQKAKLITAGGRDCMPSNRFESAKPFMTSLHAGHLAWTLAIGGFLYLAIEARSFVSPPKIYLENLPADEFLASEDIMPLSGQVYGSRAVSINGERIGTDKSGKFLYGLKLNDGVNTVVIEAKNRFGNTVKVIRTITFRP